MRLLVSASTAERPPAIQVGNTLINPQDSWEISWIRLNGSGALSGIGPEAAGSVPELCQFLQDDSMYARYVSAMVLGQIGPAATDAVPFLINALKEAVAKGDRQKTNFADALKKITRQNLGEQPERWQQWWEENKKQAKRGGLPCFLAAAAEMRDTHNRRAAPARSSPAAAGR
jgi:hypothetical protein